MDTMCKYSVDPPSYVRMDVHAQQLAHRSFESGSKRGNPSVGAAADEMGEWVGVVIVLDGD